MTIVPSTQKKNTLSVADVQNSRPQVVSPQLSNATTNAHRATPVCWFVRSLPDDRSTRIRVLPDGSYTMLVSGSANVSPYVKLPIQRQDILLPSRLPNYQPNLIFNEISSAETHSESLKHCQRLIDKFRCAVINSPEKVQRTCRHEIADQLQGIANVRIPKVICCKPRSPRDLLRLAQKAGINLPILVRESVTHYGKGLIRIRTLADRKRLNRFAFDGRNYYVTEYVDTRDTDGLYRKYRAIVVDGQPFLRHVLASDHWKIVSAQGCDLESYPERLAYEKSAIDAFPGALSSILNDIYERVGLDYFAVDYHVDKYGIVTVFEANASVDSLSISRQDVEGQKKAVDPIIKAIEAMILRRLDTTYHRSIRETALSLRLAGEYDPAIRNYQLLGRLRANPLTDLAVASVCPAVYETADQMQQYTKRLDAILADYKTRKLDVSTDDLVSTDPFPAFNLHFQNDSLLSWKTSYGEIFGRAVAAEPCQRRKHPKPRIGIVIAPRHENVYLRLRGEIFRRLAGNKWDLKIICLREFSEPLRRAYQGVEGIEVVAVDRRFPDAIRTVSELACDVLFYSTVGDDLLSYMLPFYRLAPVQATTIGMHVTSGIPAMNIYVSNRLSEPPNAAEHYSEELVQLDTLPCFVNRIQTKVAEFSRTHFGFKESEHLYVCAQPQIGKLHPDFDSIILDILQRDPLGRYVQLSHRAETDRQTLKSRWQRTLAPVLDRVTLMGYLPTAEYHSLLQFADVLLDPPYYSGINATYDALAYGKLIVTHPGQYNRGRFTSACYSKTGITEFVARDFDQYASLAASLGTDATRRRDAELRLREASQCLFEDSQIIEQFDALFETMISRGRAS